MRCPNGHENADGTRVCVRCAALLPPSAAYPSPPGPWTPAPPPPQAPGPFGPPGSQHPPAGPGWSGYGPAGPPRTPATNGLAIASLALGIVWLCGVGSVLAVVFGIVALRQIGARGEQGRGMAIAGLVLGGIGTLSLVAFIVLAAIGASSEPPPSSTFEPSTRNTFACEEDTKVLKTAILAWHANYEAGTDREHITTPYPASQEALTHPDTTFLARQSPLHDFTSDGGQSVPVITKLPGECVGEEIVQLN